MPGPPLSGPATKDFFAASMNKKLKELNLTIEQKIPLYFSLGKAYEDKENYELSLKLYIEGNKLRRSTINYNFDYI